MTKGISTLNPRLRDRDDPRVRALVDAENSYAETRLEQTNPLRQQLYEEMVDRVELSRQTVPVRDGLFEYYSRNEEDKPYPIHWRRRFDRQGSEELVLDENDLARGNAYFALEFLQVSPDHRRCIFGVDTAGDERFALFVKELTGSQSAVTTVEGAAAGVAWANDSRTFYSLRLDERNRPHQLVRHRLANGSISEEIVFEETDETFRLRLSRTESSQFLILTSWAHDTTELHYLNADQPEARLTLLRRRQPGVEAYATHHGQAFYILTNENAPTKRIVTAPIHNPGVSNPRVFLDARPDVEISYMQAYADFFVVCERKDGLSQLRIIDLRTGHHHLVSLPEPVYAIYPEDNRNFDTSIHRFGYSSLTAPYSVYDYDIGGRHAVLCQQLTVRGFDANAYRTERILVPSPDGVRVPLSLVYREGLQRDGSHAALLYGYGAYGYCVEAEFSSVRLSLLDRGFVYAIAHVRGGGELGQDWHTHGKGRLKHNSFNDFVACAEYLVREGYTSPERLGTMGESAGGLLVAAAINKRPNLFAAAVLDNPFVDVVDTLGDETLPFTISEWKEWGNPSDPDDYAYLRSYSPCDNVRDWKYPSLLILCSFNDPRVPYWEALKWAALIRDVARTETEVLLKIRVNGGHQGVTDRFEEVNEWALIYAFLLERLLK
jgi:oligopeptidase B